MPKITKAKTKPAKPTAKPKKKRSKKPSFYNLIHKKLMLLYGRDFTDMRELWKQVRRDYRAATKVVLPRSLRKDMEKYLAFEAWIDERIEASPQRDLYYLNKSDLKVRGWSDVLLAKLYPKPDYKMYLGRGRYAYYYEGNRAGELEDSEEFIEHIARKLERQRRRSAKSKDGFGSEFILR